MRENDILGDSKILARISNIWLATRIFGQGSLPLRMNQYSIDICLKQNMFSILTQISVSILSVKTVIFKAIQYNFCHFSCHAAGRQRRITSELFEASWCHAWLVIYYIYNIYWYNARHWLDSSDQDKCLIKHRSGHLLIPNINVTLKRWIKITDHMCLASLLRFCSVLSGLVSPVRQLVCKR